MSTNTIEKKRRSQKKTSRERQVSKAREKKNNSNYNSFEEISILEAYLDTDMNEYTLKRNYKKCGCYCFLKEMDRFKTNMDFPCIHTILEWQSPGVFLKPGFNKMNVAQSDEIWEIRSFHMVCSKLTLDGVEYVCEFVPGGVNLSKLN